jgi:hypothetical protein
MSPTARSLELDDFDRTILGRVADGLGVLAEVGWGVGSDHAVHAVLHLEDVGTEVLTEAATDATFLDPNLADGVHSERGW